MQIQDDLSKNIIIFQVIVEIKLYFKKKKINEGNERLLWEDNPTNVTYNNREDPSIWSGITFSCSIKSQ